MNGLIGFGSLDQRADGCRCRVENGALVVLNHFPETTGIGVCGHTLEHDFGATQRQRPVGDVGVASDPTDVGRAPEHVVGLQVERPLGGQRSVQQVTTGAVLNAFWFASGTGCVQQEQRMLCRHPLGFTGIGLTGDGIVHPHVATGGHGHVSTRPLDNQHTRNALATAQRQSLVDDGLQGQLLATADLVVSRDNHFGTGVVDAVAQALGGEAAKHHGMGCTDAGTRLHGGHTFDGHGDVDDHAVTFLNALRLQRIGDLAGLGQQASVADLGDFAAIGLEDDRRFVAQAFFNVSVQAVVRRVQRTVCKPLEERRIAFVQRFCERCFPADQLTGMTGPIAFVVSLGFLAQRIIGSHTGHSSVFDEFFAGLVNGQYACTFISTHVVSWTMGGEIERPLM